MRQIEVINQETIIDVTAETSSVEILVRDYDSELVERFALEAQEAAIEAEESADIATAQASIATAQATIATTQAGIATTQAGIATTQSGIATTKANEASASAASALASEQAADADRIAAQAAASTATTQAGIATTQAGIATTKAGEASDSAAAALASETDAETAASTATTQAGIATTQAGIATTQASNALTSANNAAASAASAASAALNTPLTGFTTGANSTILATDTTLEAFGKTQGQINARVSGTGANGQVAFWNGTSSQTGDNDLFWDNTNKRLGIGRTTLFEKFELYSSNPVFSIINNVSNSGSAAIEFKFNAGAANNEKKNAIAFSATGSFGRGNLSFVLNSVADATNWNIANDTKFRLFGATGNVLIQNGGTFTDAGFRLDVNGTARVATSLNTPAVFSTGQPLSLYGGFTNRGRIDLFNSTTGLAIDFQGNGSSRMQLHSNGNLLIGTTTDAGFRLDVNGTARVQGRLTTTADAVVNNVGIGRGGGEVISNTRLGNGALSDNTSGSTNTAVGGDALGSNTTGAQNTAFGYFALTSNNGSLNTAIGRNALSLNTTGANNTAIGGNVMSSNTTGNANTAIGNNAGRYIADGTTALTVSTNSIFLGAGSRANASSETNQIVIGTSAIGLGSNTTVLGNSSTTFGRWYGSLLLGTTTNAASSILTMESTTQGFLPPRMTTTQKNAIASPATGLVVYDNTLNKLSVFTGATWETVTSL